MLIFLIIILIVGVIMMIAGYNPIDDEKSYGSGIGLVIVITTIPFIIYQLI